MKRLERKLLLQCVLVGAALTALVVAADAARLLVPLENWLYDRRARWCQFFSPPPTKSLVHLDIDDHALEAIGHWPWPRSTWATLLDEISLAGPKAVEFDVLLSESQSPAEDAALADAMARAGNVILPIALDVRQRVSPLYREVFDALHADPEIPEDELAARMRQRGLLRADINWDELFIRARREAVYERIRAELKRDPSLAWMPPANPATAAGALAAPAASGPGIAAGPGRTTASATTAPVPTSHPAVVAIASAAPTTPGIDAPGATTTPGADGPGAGTTTSPSPPPTTSPARRLRDRILLRQRDLLSPLTRLIDGEYERLRAHEAAARFAVVRPKDAPAVTPTVIRFPPLRGLSESASGLGFVDYPQFDDQVVRAVPLFLECDGRLFPQMGLALACRMLDVDPATIRIAADDVILPRPADAGGDVRIPVAPPLVSSRGERLEMLADIPWFGPRDWRLMYDHPAHATTAQHHSLLQVWTTRLTRDKIRHNNGEVDVAVSRLLSVLAPEKGKAYESDPPPPDEIAKRETVVRSVLADERVKEALALYESMTEAERQADPDALSYLEATRWMNNWLAQTPALAKQLGQQRADLAAALKGRAALIGWIATAAVADFVPTSLHDKCPGVVVHGAVYNGIVTGELWRRAPWAVTLVLTVVLGLATAGITGYFPPVPAVLSALALFAGYALVNGIALFDYGNRVVGAAAPLVAVALVWAGCTATRVVVERAERDRIRKRFSNYVDPKLVNYVLDNPTANFNGEKREMTVVFTDLVGFTTLSEKMGEKVVPLLNSLLEELVPVIRDVHQGYINKFLGDGIMFFFNAPYLTPTHAGDAVATVLAMQETLGEFNRRLVEGGLPPLGMRAGISTAEMIVGNAGGAGANDYTVLGDAVNLGARLEAANKLTGTRTLMTARTAELLDGKILCRPIGRLKVVGKDEPAMVYEPLVADDKASERDRDLAALTTIAVDAFVTARFADALLALDQIDALTAAPSKLTTLYRRLCDQYLAEPPGEGFDGRVVLTEK